MEKNITKTELKKLIIGVLSIAPDLNTGEVWLALQKKYSYNIVEKIMNELEEEKIAKLRTIDAEIKVLDDDGNEISLEELIDDKEQKKKR